MDEQGWADRGRAWAFRVVWTLLGLGAVVTLPVQWDTGRPLWLAEPRLIVFALLGGIGYLGAVAAASQARAAGRWWGVLAAAVATAGMFGLLAAIPTVFPQFPVSRLILIEAGALTLLLVCLPPLVPSIIGPLGVALLGSGLALAHIATGGATPLRSFTVDSQFYLLRAELHRDQLFEASENDGGGLSVLGRDVVWMSGDGTFAQIRFTDAGTTVRRLDLPSPVNRAAFKSAAGPTVFADEFRATDVHAEEQDGSVRLYVTHHFWHEDRACAVFRVSTTTSDEGLDAWERWRTVFESEPCLPLGSLARGGPFAGGGGRMARVPDGLLVTVGDHGHDGLNRSDDLPQDDASDYGKIILIRDGSPPRTVSKGHRNPQGLTVDALGRIWATEHGPRGGDELNLIRDSTNYGWPLRTLGTEYGLREWPLQEAAGAEFTEPVLAWVPSIGVSVATAISGSDLAAWDGDLLIGSLKARTIFRVRLDGDRPVYTEPIYIGYEVRDLAVLPNGRLLVWTDERLLLEIAPGTNSSEGAALVGACASCHTFGEGQRGGIGPNLFQVAGRRVASMGGYRYSDALQALGGRWTPDRLDAFLADPSGFAPGTTMDSPDLADADQRRALIDYLTGEGLRATGAPPPP